MQPLVPLVFLPLCNSSEARSKKYNGGLNQVRRVAGESDEDREVRLQALRTKKVLDPVQYHWNLW